MARRKGLNFYKKRKKISSAAIREIFHYIFGIFASVLIAFVLVFSIGMSTSVVGVSMEPKLYNGQKILINRLVYLLSAPKRGDVVAFLPNGNENAHYYVKRVVGRPGDRIQIIDGRLYVNGDMADSDEYDKMADEGIAAHEILLGNDEYFVLGDNRNNSEDSRSANIGAVKGSHIAGKVWFRLAGSQSGIGFVK